MTVEQLRDILNNPILNISQIEKGAKIPKSTLLQFVSGHRMISKKNLKKAEQYLSTKGFLIAA